MRHLSPEDAAQALYVRLPWISQSCSITPAPAADPSTAGFRGTILVSCSKEEDIGPKVVAELAAIDVAPPSSRFHVVVLLASRKDGPMPELPAGEAKALADFKRVMTYRSFTLDAETMIASDRNAMTQLNDSYGLEFALTKMAGSDVIDVRPFRLMSISALPSSTGERSIRIYLDTSFSIKVGETIVLGSSVSDQTARVVLVTALP